MQISSNFTLINPVSHQTLIDELSGCLHPEQKVKYLSQKGQIQPIMRGWYLVNPKADNFSTLKAANIFYEPSYVSMHTALSYLGFISDRTYLVESVCIGRGKTIENKIGTFVYARQDDSTFFLGVEKLQISKNIEILIASPTKALYDLFLYKPHLIFSGKNDLLSYLEDDLRFDTDRLSKLDLPLLNNLIKSGKKSRQINILVNLINSL
jgi:predicted transcriptional regulator of viral defense system